MHLKKLALLGFKSFPELTELEFGPGMTGVVGPNGCGKTNILDALRWVLGEQRTTALRSGKMEEVIFNGSRDAKPLGMSEVSLTIANSRGVLPTQYTDLTITRRLYRSGESEYMMNRQPCRLRDILDLFADTGMGAHSYSVIQQDMIDAVLSEKDEERRFLFDEAAGITRYKHRKKAALRKLEATEADLVRIQDITAEVRTRVLSLKRQSNKAQRYVELKERWRDLQLRLARSDYESLQDRVRTQTSRASNLKSDLDASRAQLSALESRRDALQAEVDGVELGVDEARQRLAECDHALSGTTAEREKATAEGRAIDERQHEIERELEALAARRRDLETRIVELERDLVAAHEESEAAREDAARRVESRSRTEAQWQSARDLHSRVGQEADNAQARCRKLESELVHAETTLVSLCESLSEAEAAYGEAESELAAAGQEMRTREADEQRARATLAEAEGSLDLARQNLQSSRTDLQKTEEELSEAQTALAEVESRRRVLASWIETYRGYHGAVPDLLTRDRVRGLHDTVAEIIRPVEGYETAIAAALGERAEYLVCHDRETADLLLRRLEATDVGRATLIIMDGIEASAPRALPLPGMRPLKEFARVGESFTVLRDFLFADVFLWDRSDAELDLKAVPRDVTLVTPTGRKYRGMAEASGGTPAAKGLLARKDELERLDHEVRLQTEAVAGKRDAVLAAQSLLQGCDERVGVSDEALRAAQETYRTASLEAERARTRMEAATANHDRDRRVCDTLRERVSSAREQIETLKRQRVVAEEAFTELRIEAQTSQSDFETSERVRTEAILQTGEAQVRAVSLKAKVDGLASDRDRTREMLSEIQGRIVALVVQLTESGRRREAIADILEEVAARRASLEVQRQELEAGYRAAREGSHDLLVRLQESEKELKAARKQAEEIGGHHHAAEMAASEARLEVSSLCDRIRDMLSIELAEASSTEPVDPGQRGLLAAEVGDLKQRLEGMGTVNMLALEEYDEQKARLDFLEQQLTDMHEAKKDLLDTITRINETARSLFADTFARVQQNFNTLFSQLFEGGEAHVELTLPEDPLESPIAVMARPRGKRPVSILQLSGGERALTAIALLFALYMVKPSPFCILDEIDAPLDDANIGRFLSLLDRFSEDTQFIIITHNKMTMQAVDVLYGVTMERPGISKVVAVKLNEALETAGVS